jgi:hypothetical protein
MVNMAVVYTHMELILIGSGALLGVVAYYLRPVRLYVAGIAMIVHGFGTGLLFAHLSTLPMFISMCFGIAMIFNYARLVIHRLHARHLKLAFFVGGARLLVLQLAFYLLAIALDRYESLTQPLHVALLGIQIIASVFVLVATIYRLYASRPKNVAKYFADRELPSISVLIPARNESEDLMELLRGVVASDYPKLEVLVLDDCSGDKRIPEIVKSFAHDGVRFIEGDTPKDDWLAKNQAYDTLAQSSSGDWLIFMGVDVRLGVGSIRALMHYALNHDRSMLSVLPRRYGGAFWGGFFTPLRYFKEMLKSGVWKFNAPALSTLWLINREEYLALGGMPSVARKVIPEHYFANHLHAKKKYSFVRTNDYLQIATAKSLKEQMATSIRTLYPGLHRRLEWTATTILAMGLLLFAPFVGLLLALINHETNYIVVYGVMVALLSTAHLLVTTYTNPILWPLAIVNFPYLVLQEITLYVISMYRYEFGSVIWKDRNICQPVLQVIPRLPNIDTKS